MGFRSSINIRTVKFEYNKMKIDDFLLSQVEKLLKTLERKEELLKILTELLSQEEIESLIARIKKLLKDRRLPELDPYINVPYPLV